MMKPNDTLNFLEFIQMLSDKAQASIHAVDVSSLINGNTKPEDVEKLAVPAKVKFDAENFLDIVVKNNLEVLLKHSLSTFSISAQEAEELAANYFRPQETQIPWETSKSRLLLEILKGIKEHGKGIHETDKEDLNQAITRLEERIKPQVKDRNYLLLEPEGFSL